MFFPFGVILIAGVLIAKKFHKQMQIHKHSHTRSDFFYYLDSAAFKIHTLIMLVFILNSLPYSICDTQTHLL